MVNNTISCNHGDRILDQISNLDSSRSASCVITSWLSSGSSSNRTLVPSYSANSRFAFYRNSNFPFSHFDHL